MSEVFSAIFWGVVTFSLLVVVHEGGHFAMARAFGVKVHEFMIGLPGPAVRYAGKKTTYGITAIPLGGYVRIAGMEPGPEHPLLGRALESCAAHGTIGAQTLAADLGVDIEEARDVMTILADWDAITIGDGAPDADGPYVCRYASDPAITSAELLARARSVTFRGLSTPKRIAVLSAGVVLNLLTAILVFTVVLSAFGYLDETGRLGTVSEGSAADKAGIRPGDRIVTFDGTRIDGFEELIHVVAAHEAGEVVRVTIRRGEQVERKDITLGENPDTGHALLGVAPELKTVKPSVPRAAAMSFTYIGMTFQAITGFFSPSRFGSTVENSSSVIGAAVYASEAAKSGPLDYARLVAILSLSLGAINIVPIPPLDGGKVLIELIERLRGRPLPRNLSLGVSAGGAILLFALIGYLMYVDVLRLIG